MTFIDAFRKDVNEFSEREKAIVHRFLDFLHGKYVAPAVAPSAEVPFAVAPASDPSAVAPASDPSAVTPSVTQSAPASDADITNPPQAAVQ